MSITIPTDAYCSVDDVRQLLPNRKYDTSSKPTLEQAENSIKSIAEEISAVLRALGFSPPLTNANDIKFLKYVNQLGGAWMCETGTLIGVQGTSELAQSYKEKYERMIEGLQEGLYKLPSAGASDSSTPDANDDLDASGTRSEPIFSISSDERENQF